MNTAELITTSRFYLGGMIERGCREGAARPLDTNGTSSDSFRQHVSGEHALFLRVHPQRDHTATQGRVSIMLRGYAVLDSSAAFATGLDALLPILLEHYRTHQDLPIERLEGSFTIALLDGEAGRLLLYRNIVGTGFTYYAQTPEGMLFGSNLADLVRSLPRNPGPNTEVLPAYFLYRCVPGARRSSRIFSGCCPASSSSTTVGDCNASSGRRLVVRGLADAGSARMRWKPSRR